MLQKNNLKQLSEILLAIVKELELLMILIV